MAAIAPARYGILPFSLADLIFAWTFAASRADFRLAGSARGCGRDEFEREMQVERAWNASVGRDILPALTSLRSRRARTHSKVRYLQSYVEKGCSIDCAINGEIQANRGD
jgi:hypothetical protein